MRDCFTPIESNEGKQQRAWLFLRFDTNKKERTEILKFMRDLFLCDNNNLAGGKSYGFYSVFQYLLLKILAIYVKAAKSPLRVHFFKLRLI